MSRYAVTSQPIPEAESEYSEDNEISARRAIEQNFDSIQSDIDNIRNQTDGTGSAALRRKQFLLMGASSG
jgi:hypothetical protein